MQIASYQSLLKQTNKQNPCIAENSIRKCKSSLFAVQKDLLQAAFNNKFPGTFKIEFQLEKRNPSIPT